MKCDKLMKYGMDDPTIGDDYEMYRVADVDEAIDELKAENAELKAEINRKEAVGKRWFERCMEARAENFRLKRALWMARKAHAVAMVAYWDSHYRDNPNAVYRNRTVDWLRNRWLLILDSIIKKEKEYK